MIGLERVTSGVPTLDEMLGGGFIPQSAILLRGAPGTGKTTLGLQYLLAGARLGEPGLFITFEEFPQSVYRDAASVGWDLPQWEASGLLHMRFTSPTVLRQSLATPDSSIVRTIEQRGIRRVVVDSLSHFTQEIADDHELRRVYHQVVSAFRREGVTAFYLGEDMRSDYAREERGRLSFVVDTLILLRYLEIDSAIQRAIVVLKMRSSPHDTGIHSYSIAPGGITVGDLLSGKSGLLSGLTQNRTISTVR